MSFTTTVTNAISRLASFYNGLAYNPSTNPGGLASGGNRVNFEPSLQDIATVANGIASESALVASNAAAAATSAANASSSAGSALTYLNQTTTKMSLPFARLMAIGDSNTQRNMIGSLVGANGYNVAYRAIGPISWMNVLMNNPFQHVSYWRGDNDYNRGDNKGISGDTTAGVLLRLDRDILQENPDVVIVYIGANDLATGVNRDVTVKNIYAIVNAIIRNGAKVILCTIAPRNQIVGSGYTATVDADRLYINAKLVALAAKYWERIKLVDLSAMGVWSTDRYVLPAGYTNDGIHFNKAGAYEAFNTYLRPVVEALIGGTVMPRVIPGAYDSSLAPNGNILTNPTFTGTGGTLGSQITGTIPTSWRALRSGTSPNSVASIVSAADINGDTRNWIRHVITSAGNGLRGDYVDTRHYAAANDLFNTGAVVGEWYVGEIEIIVESVSAGVNILDEIALRIVDTEGDDSYASCFYVYDTTYPTEKMPDGTFRMILRTPPLQCRGTTGFNFIVRAYIDGTLSGTRAIQFCAPVFHRIAQLPAEKVEVSDVAVFGIGAASFIVVPPRFITEQIVIENRTANAVSGLKFGTTAGGTDIVASIAVGASATVCTKPSDLAKVPVSSNAAQLFYFDAVTAWNSANVNIYLVGKRF